MNIKYKQVEDIIVNALNRVITRVTVFLVIGALISSIIGWSLSDNDDTDGQERSGLKLRTDHGTGCQYLETVGGGITPRMDGDVHMGCL